MKAFQFDGIFTVKSSLILNFSSSHLINKYFQDYIDINLLQKNKNEEKRKKMS